MTSPHLDADHAPNQADRERPPADRAAAPADRAAAPADQRAIPDDQQRPQAAPVPASADVRTLPPPRRVSSALVVGGAILQLAALGVVMPVVLSIVSAMIGAGLGLLVVFGIGILILIAVEYALFAIAWLEVARVDGLYRFGLAPRRLRRSGRPGFGGFLRTIWLQLIDPNVWRAVANLAISTVLGWIVLLSIGVLSSGVALAFAPIYAGGNRAPLFNGALDVPLGWATPIGVVCALLAAAAIAGIGVLHGVVARAILVPSREAQLAEEARTSKEQRAGAVRAADVERTRIERDLHDGVQPRLVSIAMTLGLAQHKFDSEPETAKALIAEAHTSTKAAITELRQLARGIHTSVLDDRGLDASLSALGARSPIPVVLDVQARERCGRDAEAAVYFVVAESLTNAAKHSRASECRVLVREREAGTLWVRIEDNGVGGARSTPGGGLDGIANRVLGAGGSFHLDSPVGGPTTVEVTVPCAS